MAVAHLNEVDLYHELHGVDDGPLVLNIGGTGGDLRRTFPDKLPLNEHFRVLSYDQRGLGRSGHPDGEWTMADYADDAAALVEHLGWTRCHVVGTSFGGMVAQHLAIRHPSRVERLVLNCTSPGGEHPSYPLHDLDGMDPEAAFEVRMRLTDSRWDPDADEPIPGLGTFYDVMAAQARSTPEPSVADGLARQVRARAGHDAMTTSSGAGLGGITSPTLVCAGRYDDLAPLANSELLAASIPDARLEVFDGGHIFMLQDRSAYRMIGEFLAGSTP